MKKMNKLVALLLAAVMVLGMLPATTAHAAENHTPTVEQNGIEEYPALTADTPATVTIANGGDAAYFTFTPEKTDLYYYYSADLDSYVDTKGSIYTADMEMLNSNDDSNYGSIVGVWSPHFCMAQVMEAGTTYVLTAQAYSNSWTGNFSVNVMTGHEYTSAVTKEPSCTEDGVLTYTCSHCGDTYDEPIPAAHNYSDETGACIYCGEVYLVTGICGDDLTWELDWFGNLTIKGTGEMYDYVITWDNNSPAPWYNDYLEDITALIVEEGVTSIGNYAFYRCQDMTSISLPDSLTSLGSNSFSSCYGLTEITLPDSLTTIPDYCFAYCGGLNKINWSDSLTTVGNSAFYNCDLPDLVLPEGITAIGSYAFSSNSRMSKLTLPSTLTELTDYAFASCYYLKNIVFTGDAPIIPDNVFYYTNVNAWYPTGNTTWTADILGNYGGTVTWNAVCAEHNFSAWTTIEATCERGAYMTRSCTVCGWTENGPEGDPLGHDYQYSRYDGGCGGYSYDIVTCSRCDYYATENWVWGDHDYAVTVIEATCTTNGYTMYTCTRCGSYYTDNYVYATGHVVESWSEPTEATCTEPSVRTGTCSVCGETATEEVSPALGHTWGEDPVLNEDGSETYTCTVCGATYRTEGTYLYLGDNDFSITGGSGRTTKTFTAEQAGTLTITMQNMVYHNKQAYDNGWTDQYWQELGISWCFSEGFFNVYINDVNTGYTSNGDHEVILNSIDVNAGDVVTVEVNHLSASYYYNNDVKCNMNLTLEGDHTHEYTAVVTEPTCTEGGYTTYTCECGDSYVADETPALGHTEEVLPAVEPTFDTTGLTEGKKCSVCGEILAAQEEVPMLDYNDGIVPLEVLIPTAGDWQTGYEDTEGPAELAMDDDLTTIWHTNWYGTSRENHWIQFELTESYAVDGLRYKPRTTGNTNGIITEYDIQVSNDGETFRSVASGNWAGDRDWKVVEFPAENVKYVRLVAVDAITDNSYVFACAAEIRLTGEKAAAHEHSYEAVVTAPTCTEGGYTTYTCACGDSYVADETPALGHDWKGLDCERCDATRENPFTDVSAEHHAAFLDAILWAVEEGVTTGTGDGTTFDPNGKCQRASVVTFLWRAAGKPEPTTTENPFTDVKETDFFYKAVLWAVEQGITNGTSETTFSPYAECNRAAVVTFLYRAENEPAVTATESGFTDVTDPDAFYYNAVLWAVENGITNGMGDGTFGIGITCNRAQVVTFLYRAANN